MVKKGASPDKKHTRMKYDPYTLIAVFGEDTLRIHPYFIFEMTVHRCAGELIVLSKKCFLRFSIGLTIDLERPRSSLINESAVDGNHINP